MTGVRLREIPTRYNAGSIQWERDVAGARVADDRQTQAYLPDFCAAGTVLVILLVAELVAILLTLVSFEPGSFLTELSKMSMFVLWQALLGTVLLCQIRPWAERQGNTRAFVICFIVLEIMVLVLAEATWQLTQVFGEAAPLPLGAGSSAASVAAPSASHARQIDVPLNSAATAESLSASRPPTGPGKIQAQQLRDAAIGWSRLHSPVTSSVGAPLQRLWVVSLTTFVDELATAAHDASLAGFALPDQPFGELAEDFDFSKLASAVYQTREMSDSQDGLTPSDMVFELLGEQQV